MNRQLHHQLSIRAFIILFALWLAISAPLIASAHGGEVRIELNVTQASPGATIGLRGSGFEQGDTVTIMLVGANGQFLLGTANADGDGDLTHALLLPLDLASGAYEVRVADMHHAAAAPLNIVPDSSGDEEGSQRDEDEPLLATMPLPRRAIVPLSSQTAAAPTPTANARDSLAWLLLLPVGTLVVAGTALIVKKRFAR